MYRVGFSLQRQYGRPISEVIALLKEAGFCAVSPVWTPDLDLSTIAESVRQQGMTIQSLHAPHKGVPLLWEPENPLSAEAYENVLRSIDACVQFHIPTLVMHGWQGPDYTFPQEPLDFCLFDKIVRYARRNRVFIAFENLEGEEYLAALMRRYRCQPHVGYCWDSGHDHGYPHKLDFLQEFGHRLFVTHLNDNLGNRGNSEKARAVNDLHFIPFDGNIQWDSELRRLKNKPRQTILNFELKRSSHSTDPDDLPYLQLSLEAYIQKAGIQAQKIAAMYAEIISEP